MAALYKMSYSAICMGMDEQVPDRRDETIGWMVDWMMVDWMVDWLVGCQTLFATFTTRELWFRTPILQRTSLYNVREDGCKC